MTEDALSMFVATREAQFSPEDPKVSTEKKLLYDAAQADNVCHTFVASIAYLRVATKGMPMVVVRWTDMRLEKRH